MATPRTKKTKSDDTSAAAPEDVSTDTAGGVVGATAASVVVAGVAAAEGSSDLVFLVRGVAMGSSPNSVGIVAGE